MVRVKMRRRTMPEPPAEFVYAERMEDGGWGVNGVLVTAKDLVAEFEPMAPCPELDADLAPRESLPGDVRADE